MVTDMSADYKEQRWSFHKTGMA